MAVSVYGIDRALWDHPDLAEEPYTQKQAWAWLIGAAAYQDKRIRTTRGPITLKRGEFWFSVRFLAAKWLWSKSRVDRFLDMLVKRDMLRDELRDNIQLYFVINYNKFQIVKAPKRDNNRDDVRASSGTAAGQQRDKEKDTEDSEDNKLDLTTFGLALTAACAAASLEAVRLPTNRFDSQGEEVSLSKAKADEYAKTYPGVNVVQELAEMRQWLIENAERRKTRKGMAKFVNGWLAREQDRGPRQARASPQSAYQPAQILSILEPKPQCH